MDEQSSTSKREKQEAKKNFVLLYAFGFLMQTASRILADYLKNII